MPISSRVEDVPHVFKCPITLQTMADPVIAADGHAYERDCITQWFETGACTSPLTREPLRTLDLFTAYPLRDLMQKHPIARLHLRKPMPQAAMAIAPRAALSVQERDAESVPVLCAMVFTSIGLASIILYVLKAFAQGVNWAEPPTVFGAPDYL